MSNDSRPGQPTAPGTQPTPPAEPLDYASAGSGPDSLERYNRVAETIGMVPSLRRRDNFIQGAIVLVGIFLGVGAGLVFAEQVEMPMGGAALIGGLLGLVVFGVASGFVLMIVGLTGGSGRG